jgi:hypothetical protein
VEDFAKNALIVTRICGAPTTVPIRGEKHTHSDVGLAMVDALKKLVWGFGNGGESNGAWLVLGQPAGL